MRLQRSALSLLLLSNAVTTSHAFVVVDGPVSSSRRKSRIPSFVALNAVNAPLLPPPPPPPPLSAGESPILEQTVRYLQNVVGSLDGSAFLTEQLNSLKQQLATLDASMLQKLQTMATDLNHGILADNPGWQPVVQQISTLLQPLFQSPTLTLAGSAVLTYVLVSSILNAGQGPPPTQPYPENKYDPTAARAYFDKRLPQVMARGLEIFVQSVQFGVSVLRDSLDDKMAANEEQRGRELAELLCRLGPTFIKVNK